jgi:hypothetical protein
MKRLTLSNEKVDTKNNAPVSSRRSSSNASAAPIDGTGPPRSLAASRSAATSRSSESGRLAHPGQAQLDTAVTGARRRPVGDAGLWAWDRRDGSVFVAPLVAATLARHGAVTAGRPRSNHAVFV